MLSQLNSFHKCFRASNQAPIAKIFPLAAINMQINPGVSMLEWERTKNKTKQNHLHTFKHLLNELCLTVGHIRASLWFWLEKDQFGRAGLHAETLLSTLNWGLRLPKKMPGTFRGSFAYRQITPCTCHIQWFVCGHSKEGKEEVRKAGSWWIHSVLGIVSIKKVVMGEWQERAHKRRTVTHW